jgi:diguanylate cyclase (GGDEF)-like protein
LGQGRAGSVAAPEPDPGEVWEFETLAGAHPSVGSTTAEKRELARAQSYNFITGGLCGLAILALPHPGGWEVATMVVLGPLAVLIGLALYRFADRLPMWVLAVGPGLGTLMATGAIALTGTALSPFAVFYLWIAFYATYFLARPAALLNLAFVALNAALVAVALGAPPMEIGDGADAVVPWLVVAATTVLAAAILFHYQRDRLSLLVGSLAEVAQTDLLTGLPNSRSFRATLEAEISRAIPAGRPVSVLIGDVDRLRKLTDGLGLDSTDRLMRAIGESIREERPAADTVGRVGHGTFAIALPETDEHDALIAAEDLLTTIRRGFRAEGGMAVTMSFGAATFPKDAGDAASLLRAADLALDAAKVLGRDRAVVASPELDLILSGRPRPSVDESIAHLKTLLSLAEALDLRNAYTASHAQNVGELCAHIARELGLSEPRVVRIRLAGILHDIGKVAVPDEILYSDGPLDEGQWKRMKRHPEIGARILGSSELADIRAWVLASHERPDGKGYPRGLAGGEIPLESRIIYVADAYETMTTDHTYRASLGDEKAREELRRGTGTEFDGEVVDALFAVLDRPQTPAKSKQ